MDDQQGDKVTLNHLNKSTTKANDQQGDEVTLSHLNKSATKKWQPKKWTDTKKTKKQKKIDDASPWTKWTDQKKKKFDDEVTLSYVGKSTT